MTVWLALASIAGFGILGCASRPAAKSAVHQQVQPGYAPEHHYQTSATSETWIVADEPVDVRLLVPVQAGSYPLVFYFPGLGESADAGLAWRHFWAEAGYAVLSAQPAKYGTAVWSSGRAHTGDFLDIAKDAFAVPSLSVRAGLARALLDETWRRKNLREVALGRVDVSRVAVAGYDLGAQTAMMVAGESVAGVESPQVPDGVKCVVVLSPYADFSGMGLQSNFVSIRLPVLSVTSSQDTDAYGLVTSAAVRRAPYQYMPPSQKYLLVLSGAPHSLFAGAATSAKINAAQTPSPPEDDAALDAPNDETAPRPQGHGRSSRHASPSQLATTAARHAVEVAQVQSVTTAFLDAVVKNDAIGSEWLSRNAKRWLGSSGELESK